MTTATTTTITDAPSYCASVITLLNALIRGAGGSLFFDVGSGTERAVLRVEPDTRLNAAGRRARGLGSRLARSRLAGSHE
jgi:hypothetical protein